MKYLQQKGLDHAHSSNNYYQSNSMTWGEVVTFPANVFLTFLTNSLHILIPYWKLAVSMHVMGYYLQLKSFNNRQL